MGMSVTGDLMFFVGLAIGTFAKGTLAPVLAAIPKLAYGFYKSHITWQKAETLSPCSGEDPDRPVPFLP